MNLNAATRDKPFVTLSGWVILPLLIAWAVATPFILRSGDPPLPFGAFKIAYTVVTGICLPVLSCGFFILNPNLARVLVLFGRYRGTVRKAGFHWTNPFTIKRSISLRARNLASKTIKVNDLVGNPIEIAAVVVWQVRDAAQAVFDVDDFEEYVDIQAEAAVRHMAKSHPYDDFQATEGQSTLRGDSEEIAGELQDELQRRFDRAGIAVLEGRVTHLAYAPEIASAMLQRQQASAIIAARRQIVDGAVGMVEHALEDLSKKHIVELDDERRVTLVGNLLVVLCSHSSPTPVLNTGSLYN